MATMHGSGPLRQMWGSIHIAHELVFFNRSGHDFYTDYLLHSQQYLKIKAQSLTSIPFSRIVRPDHIIGMGPPTTYISSHRSKKRAAISGRQAVRQSQAASGVQWEPSPSARCRSMSAMRPLCPSFLMRWAGLTGRELLLCR